MRTFIVFLVAFSFRYIAIANAPYSITGDEPEYATLAYNLRTYHTLSFGEPHAWGGTPHIPGSGPVIPTSARAPLYPAVLAALWGDGSTSVPIFRARMFNVLAGSVTAVACERIAFTNFGGMSAWVAGLGVALAPESAAISSRLLSETLFTTLAVLAGWLWSEGRAAMCGILLGLGILTRAIFLPLALFGLLVGVISRRRPVFVVAAMSLLTVAPWTIRNLAVTRSFVAVNTQGWGSNLFYGTIRVPYGSGNPWQYFAKSPEIAQVGWAGDVAETELSMRNLAFREIDRHPFRWLATRVHDFPRALEGSDLPFFQFSPLPFRVNHILTLLMMPLLLALAIAGCIKNRDMLNSIIPLAIPPVGLLASQTISLADIRYTLPGVPFLIVLASSLVRTSRAAGGNRARP